MNLSVSNIAWDRTHDEVAARVMAQNQFTMIDVAPGRYFPDPVRATNAEVAEVRAWWADRGIRVAGMQSLLFGTTGLNLFDDADQRARMLDHLTGVFRVAEGLGARCLVFGSPKNRDRRNLGDDEVLATAVEFFRAVGNTAARHGVTVCLEPNPVAYGANFMTTSAETAAVVEAVGHAAVRMQFDTGAVRMNDEDPETVLRTQGALIEHVHLSEPNLVPLGSTGPDGAVFHATVHRVLDRYKPAAVRCVEMLIPADVFASGSFESTLSNALGFAVKIYGSAASGAADV